MQKILNRMAAYDYSGHADMAVKFLTAHSGCITAPFLTATFLGNAASTTTDYFVSVGIGMTAMLGMDNLVQRVKLDECMRCVNSKLDGFKRQKKLMLQAVLMSSAFYFGHHLTGAHHHQPNEIQRDTAGRRFIARESVVCGLGLSHADTIWLDQPTPKLLKGNTP